MKIKYTVFVAMFVLMSIIFAGCGDKKTVGSGEGKGGVLVYGRSGDSVNLDAPVTNDGESNLVIKQILEGLCDYDSDFRVIPVLATEWNASEDGKVWTIKLRQGVKFHDGTDFNAAAVVYNFERMWDKAHPQHKNTFAPFQSAFGYKGDSVIEEIKALDNYTVQFTLNKSQATFMANLAMVSFSLNSPTAIEKYGDQIGQHPVGTGPFVFKEWKRNDSITLEKNPNYWDKNAPKLDKIIFRVIPDPTARLTALKAGEIDFIDSITPLEVEGAKQNKNLKVYTRKAFNTAYLAMNNDKAPFNDLRVRQAVSLAINIQGMTDSFLKGSEPAKGILPPSLLGYNNELPEHEYNPGKARELLTQAGYPNGFDIELFELPIVRGYMPNPKKAAEALQADLAKVGIRVKLVTFEWATYLQKIKNGEHTLAMYGWGSDNGDPDNFLYVLLDKSNAVPPSAQNISMYKNEQVHELLLKGQITVDPAKRVQFYKDAQTLISRDVPMIPLIHASVATATGKNVMGYTPGAKASESLKDIWIEKQ